MFLCRNVNKFLTEYKVIRLNEQVRISSYICKSIVRLKSRDVKTLDNNNMTAINRAVHIINPDKSKTKTAFAQQFVSSCPTNIQPYLKLMRINRPIGSWLLFWPCAWSISIAASPGCWPDPYLLVLFGTGALVMRGAGCTINDMWDRDIDSKVVRTVDRPLVNGSINMKQAWTFLAGQLSLGLLILLQLNWYSIFLGASSLALVTTYPLAKRVTYWPQLMLGMTFNWGALLGYSAVHGYVDWALCLPLYTAGICWTIIYDTIYAYQDISDDLQLGLKSTAIRFKDHTKMWLTGFSTVMSGCLTVVGILAEQTIPYYATLALISSHLAWQICTLNVTNPNDCAKKFISNSYVGMLLFAGIVLGNLVKKNKKENKEKLEKVHSENLCL